eukprot:6624997-Karenia_brevis.AAC.1
MHDVRSCSLDVPTRSGCTSHSSSCCPRSVQRAHLRCQGPNCHFRKQPGLLAHQSAAPHKYSEQTSAFFFVDGVTSLGDGTHTPPGDPAANNSYQQRN